MGNKDGNLAPPNEVPPSKCHDGKEVGLPVKGYLEQSEFRNKRLTPCLARKESCSGKLHAERPFSEMAPSGNIGEFLETWQVEWNFLNSPTKSDFINGVA